MLFHNAALCFFLTRNPLNSLAANTVTKYSINFKIWAAIGSGITIFAFIDIVARKVDNIDFLTGARYLEVGALDCRWSSFRPLRAYGGRVMSLPDVMTPAGIRHNYYIHMFVGFLFLFCL